MVDGTLYDKYRNIYVGYFIDEKLDGYGSIEYKKERCIIKGYFSNGIANGEADIFYNKFSYPQKIVSGKFSNGQLNGKVSVFHNKKQFILYLIDGIKDEYPIIKNEDGKFDYTNEEDDKIIKEIFSKCSIFKNVTLNLN